jgi:hypothetical protein
MKPLTRNRRADRIHGRAKQQRNLPVTQHVAAICDSGKIVVTASDKMITLGGAGRAGTLTYETLDWKLWKVAKTSLALVAGTPEIDILTRVRATADEAKTVADVAEQIRVDYHAAFRARMVDEVLMPLLGIESVEYFHDKQTVLNRETVVEVVQETSRIDLGATFIVAGVDTEAHIYQIRNPGTIQNCDALSYACAGAGNPHVEAVFARHRYTKYYPLSWAVFIAFAAKKAAEVAAGVGTETDMLIITQQGIRWIEYSQMASIEQIHKEWLAAHPLPDTAFHKVEALHLEQSNPPK